ncbi:MAG: hypothetical protein MSS48_09685 [Clostridiales bacterium]|uniref:Ppx/GppA phosphatase family protein n=1 Tax=Hornefia butyriciproducens TaxID=2652293 RepID=UPI0029F7AA24|nr:hypothetical protein [Hornefia butyriciproducens]MCI7680457.1 hypothetical protein [Clostridiales bacterium]MDD7019505.1 hypothetical protein [Hornefia butyriciproducens]MDY5463612.1 hypothetical protein [Hornefia butyriciproducens]
MNQAIIDIGSNSMRLTVYDVTDSGFEILFKEKVMASLAGYVEDGRLSDEGMSCAAVGLLQFKFMLESLKIENVHVFATASLRNISNTDEAEARISELTGFSIEILSGKEEAYYGYIGAMKEFECASGAFVDIGGASTEIVTFAGGKVDRSGSYETGSLRLYKDCVRKILPGERGIARIRATVESKIPSAAFRDKDIKRIICVGGTARAVLKLARRVCGVPAEDRVITRKHFDAVGKALLTERKEAADLILKVAPERIHTMIPGYLIMQYIVERFDAKEIAIGRYGVREGYLCKRILK